jgi:hypothetical protein
MLLYNFVAELCPLDIILNIVVAETLQIELDWCLPLLETILNFEFVVLFSRHKNMQCLLGCF